jgi:hypothetical protein
MGESMSVWDTPIKPKQNATRLYWRHDREGTAIKGTMWADVPRGIVRDASGFNASRVYRWPIGRDAWRVSLGVTAGPQGVKYNCPDLQAAVDLAEILVTYGQPCFICRRRVPEIAVTIDGQVTEICEKCHQIGEDERREQIADAEAERDANDELADDGYDDGLAELLRDSIKEI